MQIEYPHRKRNIRVLLLVLGLVALPLICCGGKPDSIAPDSKEASAKPEETEKERVPVKVIAVGTGTISSYITSSTTIDTEQQVEVFSKATGICADLAVEEGDRVEKGQILAKLDDSQPRLTEIQARVNRDKLAASLKRAEQMLNDELLSKEQYEDTRYRFEAAKAEWGMAKIRLEDTTITAPISGTIAQKNIQVGMNITPSINIFRIVDFDSLIATVFVPELDMGNLRIGQEVIVTTDALANKEFKGSIKRISPVVDPASGTVKVMVDLSRNSTELVPGVFIRTKIVVDTRENTLILPRRALIKEEERSRVFVITDDAANDVELGIGYSDGDRVEVLSGLESGDLIVVDGQSRLKDGTLVRIIEELPASTG
jgi:membrane fusion protein (multidrug efflux system)